MLKQGAMVQLRFTVNVILFVWLGFVFDFVCLLLLLFVLFCFPSRGSIDDFIPEDLFVMSAGMDCTMFCKAVNK